MENAELKVRYIIARLGAKMVGAMISLLDYQFLHFKGGCGSMRTILPMSGIGAKIYT